MKSRDLGLMSYPQAWAIQEQLHADVVAGGDEQLIFVEHLPVVTLGRRGEVADHVKTPPEMLAGLGVDLVHSDRGGDVTYHGPGQLVAYPIIRLADHRLSVGGYVHALESAVVSTLGAFGVRARTEPGAVGVWVELDDGSMAKICAIGVRIRRGVSTHGLALNVTTDLRQFDLIVPCGLRDRAVTSLHQLLGDRCPSMSRVRTVVEQKFAEVVLNGIVRERTSGLPTAQ